MFNYSEVDKYATIEVISTLMTWITEHQPRLRGYMISSILREKGTDNYIVHFTVAQNGTSCKYKVVGDMVEKLDYDGGFWMS